MSISRLAKLTTLAMAMAMLLVAAVACDEIEPERVDDDDDVEAVDTDETDDAEQAVTEDDDADEATDDARAEEDDDANGVADDEDAAVEEDDAIVDDDDGELEEAEGFTIGDRVRMGDLVIQLHAARWDEGDEFFGPDEGKRWLVLDIEIENEADSGTTISSILMFDLVDQENRSRDVAYMADTVGSLDGELGAGRAMRGDLAWEVDDGQSEWEFIFSPEVFGFGQAIFDISVDQVE